MNIDEAIKSLENILNNHGGLYSRKGEDALQLGIEALKAIRRHRGNIDYTYIAKLMGETENGDN